MLQTKNWISNKFSTEFMRIASCMQLQMNVYLQLILEWPSGSAFSKLCRTFNLLQTPFLTYYKTIRLFGQIIGLMTQLTKYYYQHKLQKHCVNTKWSKHSTTNINIIMPFSERIYWKTCSSQLFQNTNTAWKNTLSFFVHVTYIIIIIVIIITAARISLYIHIL